MTRILWKKLPVYNCSFRLLLLHRWSGFRRIRSSNSSNIFLRSLFHFLIRLASISHLVLVRQSRILNPNIRLRSISHYIWTKLSSFLLRKASVSRKRSFTLGFVTLLCELRNIHTFLYDKRLFLNPVHQVSYRSGSAGKYRRKGFVVW